MTRSVYTKRFLSKSQFLELAQKLHLDVDHSTLNQKKDGDHLLTHEGKSYHLRHK